MPKRSNNIKLSDLKGNKPWLKKGSSSTKSKSRRVQKTYLVICEGQTEEYYFRSFHSVAITIKAINLGRGYRALVDCAVMLSEGEEYDEIWVVFDLDFQLSAGAKQFESYNQAIRKAQDSGMNVAYSNDSFELWFYLHYAFLDRRESRDFYAQFLGKQLDMNYARDGKSLAVVKTLRQRFSDDEKADIKEAIQRAKTLYERQEHLPFHEQNPVTTVYQLVESILAEES